MGSDVLHISSLVVDKQKYTIWYSSGILLVRAEVPRYMSEDSQRQVSIRFSSEDWDKIVIEAGKYGLKPAQYIRTCVIQRLNGKLVDSGTIDEILIRDNLGTRGRRY